MSFPDLVGDRQTGQLSTDQINNSCYSCIRNGWVWCSDQWNYESGEADTDYSAASEKGKCCYNTTTKSLDVTKLTTANVTNCPVRWSNASTAGTTITALPQTDANGNETYWCSDDYESVEMALITCRQS